MSEDPKEMPQVFTDAFLRDGAVTWIGRQSKESGVQWRALHLYLLEMRAEGGRYSFLLSLIQGHHVC